MRIIGNRNRRRFILKADVNGSGSVIANLIEELEKCL